MYLIALKTENGSEIQVLPRNPEAVDISVESNHEQYSLMGQGEVVSPGFRKVKTISFSSWLPHSSSPRNIIAAWERYMAERQVIRIIATGLTYDGEHNIELNLPVVIESLKYTEKGGEPGAIFFDIVLKEYRRFSVKVIKG